MLYKNLFSIFFILFIGINVQILMRGNAPDATMNYLHIVAYSLCCAAILINFKYRYTVYSLAAMYPIATHLAMLATMSTNNVWFWAFIFTILMLVLGNVFLKVRIID